MIRAAQAARHYWERAGTWLEVERAEYRLAKTWLEAGDVAEARLHAQACLAIVEANHGAALERVFGGEALGAVEKAAGNPGGLAVALAHAREALADVAEDQQASCRESLDKLGA